MPVGGIGDSSSPDKLEQLRKMRQEEAQKQQQAEQQKKIEQARQDKAKESQNN